MFCHQCGTEIFEGNTFCHVCGASVIPEASQPPAYTPTQPQNPTYTPPVQPQNPYVNNYGIPTTPPAPVKQKSKLPIIIAAVALVAVIGIVLAIVLGGGSGSGSSNGDSDPGSSNGSTSSGGYSNYESMVEAYLNACFYDQTQLIDMYHDSFLEYYLDAEGMTLSQLRSYYREATQDTSRDMEEIYGEWECYYEITDTTTYRGSDLSEMKEEFSEYGMSITSAMMVELEMSVTGSLKDYSYDHDLYLVQAGGKWYLGQVIQ